MRSSAVSGWIGRLFRKTTFWPLMSVTGRERQTHNMMAGYRKRVLALAANEPMRVQMVQVIYRSSGLPLLVSFRQSERQRHRGPTGPRSGNKLVVAMRETGIEPGLERQRAGLHVPGTVLLLGVQQELMPRW